MIQDLSFRQAGVDDIPLIQQLAETIWRDHYIPIIGEKQVSYMLKKMYGKESLLQQMQESHVFYLLFQQFTPLGFISLSRKTEDHYFLHKFYILREHQGKGLGTCFFQRIVKSHPDMKSLRLTVNRQNFRAVNFYFSLGFTIESVEDFDIGNGFFMNDFIMSKSL
ncbi:MAG: GNAT family N-acetyltransferase [Bacteroidia bacterium]|nr:GNAT family N-acetyltransferase [Bacteroidia bacterium]